MDYSINLHTLGDPWVPRDPERGDDLDEPEQTKGAVPGGYRRGDRVGCRRSQMELGCDAVPLHSAIAHAKDPIRMARAMSSVGG